KDEILELYLNKVYFGGGTYGVNAASKYYFGHDATEITPAEAAILVIQLSNPAYYNPFSYPNRAMSRQQEVLRQMVELGYLSAAEAESSFDEYWLNFDYTRVASSAFFMREDKAPWFSEYVRRELEGMMYGTLNIYTGGFVVNTSLNLRNQQAAQDIMERNIAYANRVYRNTSNTRLEEASRIYAPMTELLSLTFNLPQLKVSEERNRIQVESLYKKEINPLLDIISLMSGIDELKVGIVNKANTIVQQEASRSTIEGALVSLENETGYITALIGGSRFDSSNQFIRATQAKVQPGSTFKPLYYSAAIDSRKYTAASIIYDSPIVFYNENNIPYVPLNFKGEWQGPVQLWYALARSMNIPSLKVVDGIGFDAVINRTTALLGIDPSEVASRNFDRVYPLGLGICSVRPIEIARAYAVFGNQGKEVTPIAIRSVEDRFGKVIIDPEKELRLEQKRKGTGGQVISPQTAFIMNDILMNSVSMGTLAGPSNWGGKFTYTDSRGKRYMMPAAGKTGTTQNWADAWAVGYTPYTSTAVWFGFDRGGQSLSTYLTGSTLAGPALTDYMRIIHEGLPYKEFPMPQTGLIRATVCSVSGLILTDACGDHKTTQYFLEGTQPVTTCDLHVNRASAQSESVIRLENEKVLTGYSEHLVDNVPLVLDLSFLTGLSSVNMETNAAEHTIIKEQDNTETEGNDSIPSDEIGEPVFNYLLD
ncbi:MAG: transglycosylase domain-containing protein, partial [Spirochaetaceae bacterium]|nr:transglycosylase domain-containing protein [Spirochaetaceae bacterium]